ncbi:MAG: uracil phosphoribosyltransferase [Taibaiella sp.]|nr:uracil phosphoribosyltransferase [Taibaiella sp.]
MVTNLSDTNSILCNWIAQVRDINIQQDRMRFRRNMERIGEIAAYEISKYLPYAERNVQTPMGEALCNQLEQVPVLATLLRAGLPLHQGIMNYFDNADNAFIAGYRKHHRDGSFEIAQYYVTSPDIAGRPLIVSDPMLATGASLVLALQSLLENGEPSQLHVVSVIACTEGVEHVKRKFPNAYIWAGAIDEELTARGYIVPGLGDAGDLSFGVKTQS